MKINKSIIINAPITKVWKILAEDFDKASEWMSAVPDSYHLSDNSGAEGRVCHLSDNPEGLRAKEIITLYDADNYRIKFDVNPEGAGIFPINKNQVDVSLKSLGVNKTKVSWISDVDLKTLGKVMSPLLKVGLNKSFADVLDDLKYFVENNTPHPRKLKKIKQSA